MLHKHNIKQRFARAHQLRTHTWARILLLVIGILFASLLATAHLALPSSPTIVSPFIYSFNASGVLQESGTLSQSTSPYFWLNSGGEMHMDGKSGSTMQGEADTGTKWQTLYARSNPSDTDQGLHPQNLFRLITKSLWQDVSAQAQFFIVDDNFSTSPNRNSSNGLSLMSRYTDGGQTLYYAGVRVDGTAVIKKKYQGKYYTLAQTKLFPGDYQGSQDRKNLIPHRQWIGLRSETTTHNGDVVITLFVQQNGVWRKVLQASDHGQDGHTPILTPGYVGVRTDFMDVKFGALRLQTL